LYPCKSSTSEEVIKHLCDYFQSYSKPKRLISDHAHALLTLRLYYAYSAKFSAFVNEWSVEHVLIAVGTPRANGQAERLIVPMLSKLVEDPKKWDRELSSIEFSLNNTVSRATNTTSNKLLFGVEQHEKCNDKIREILDSISDSDRDLSAIKSDASKAIAKLQSENEKSFNAKRKAPTIYKEGDYIVVQNIDTTLALTRI